jgi:hypothetical protein
MMRLNIVIALACSSVAFAAEWGAPVDVLHEMKPCVTYRARLDGDLLVVEAALQPGWKTFAIDNEQRAAEKRAGKPSLGIDQPTQITPVKGLEIVGPWYESPPKDFSKPQLRWYTFGYQEQAKFAVKAKMTGSGPAEIGIRGQACTDTTCKNIDVTLLVPRASASAAGSSVDLKTMVQAAP